MEELDFVQLDSIVEFLVLLVIHQYRSTFVLSPLTQMHQYSICIALQAPLEAHKPETSFLRIAFLEPIYLPLVQILRLHHLISFPREAARRFLLLWLVLEGHRCSLE